MSNWNSILKKGEKVHDFRIKFYKEELELLTQFKIKNVLEICSGDGRNLVFMKEQGYKVIGIENPDFLDETLTKKENITILKHPIFDKKLPFKDCEFDFVYSYQYLNHNYKDKMEALFEEFYRVVRKGGLVSIKTTSIEDGFNLRHVKNDIYEETNTDFPMIQYKKIGQVFFKLTTKEANIPHYAFYKNELIESLKKVGFSILSIRTVGWNFVVNMTKN